MKRIVTTLSQKWPEYLIESVVIIASILGAFALDSWNEERSIRNSERTILKNLKEELTFNKNELLKINELHAKSISCGIELLKLFKTDIYSISKNHIDSLFAYAETFHTFEHSDGYIKSIISSGKIDHLRNEKLKTMITAFEGQVIDATQEGTHVHRLLHERLWPLMDGRISQADRLKKFGFMELPTGSYSSDYAWLFQEKEIEDILMNMMGWLIESQRDEKDLLKFIDDMLTIVNQELKN